MPTAFTALDIKQKIATLQRDWSVRDAQFKEDYKLLTFQDVDKKAKVETVESNEPRTFFNTALHMLTAQPLTHRLARLNTDWPVENYIAVEKKLRASWQQIDRTQRRAGRDFWSKELGAWLLLTGWGVVQAVIDSNEVTISEVWNPIEVYPDFGSDGIITCAHVYVISAAVAMDKIKRNKWKAPTFPYSGNVTVYDYFTKDGDDVIHAIIFNDDFVVAPETINDIVGTEIPVIICLTGGIPDNGSLSSVVESRKIRAQGILAANREEYRNYNRQLSFVQHVARQAAQAKWKEHTKGGRVVATAEQLEKYGEVFSYGEGEDLNAIETPPIPPEIRELILSTEARMQRGAFPYIMYGGIQSGVSGFAANQLISAARQVLQPYDETLRFIAEEVDYRWLTAMKDRKLSDYELVPKNIAVEVGHDLALPSDMANRVTMSRMLTSEKRILSHRSILDKVMEVKDSDAEIDAITKEESMERPEVQEVELIQALGLEAEHLRKQGNRELSSLFLALSKLLRKNLLGEETEAQKQPVGRPTTGYPQYAHKQKGVRPRVMGAKARVPPQFTPPEAMGQEAGAQEIPTGMLPEQQVE